MYRVRDRITGLPGVCPTSIGKQVKEQHLGPQLEGNGNKDIAGDVPYKGGPSQMAEPGPEISESCMVGPLGSGHRNQAESEASAGVGETGTSPARGSPRNWG